MKFNVIRKNVIAALCITVCTVAVRGQNYEDAIRDIDQGNFVELAQAMNDFYAEHPQADGYKLWKRKECYLRSRLDPDGRIVNIHERNLKAYLKYQQSQEQTKATPHGAWLFLGPTELTWGQYQNISLGRINSIDIDPANASTLYICSSSGGVWKTTNDGTTWTNISPSIPVLSVRDMEIDRTDPNTLYIATGDPFNTPGQSIGVLKTVDAGLTWHPTAFSLELPSGFYPEKLLMHPTDGDIQFIGGNVGLFGTSDGWETYDTLFFDDSSSKPLRVFDIEYKPGSTDTIYCSIRSAVRRSVDGGVTWNTLFDSDFTLFAGSVRVEIAVTEDNPECIYAYGASSEPRGLLRSLSSGDNGTWTTQDASISLIGGQGTYNMGLAVSNSNFEHVSLGQVWTLRSTNGGQPGSWQGPTNYVHADVHDIQEQDGSIYHGNDGGIFKSTDGGLTFTDLTDGLAITEIYRIAGTPQDANFYLMGNQDNGSFRRTSMGGTNFTTITQNDGTECLVDYTNKDIIYMSTQFGFLYKSTNGGTNVTEGVGPDTTGVFLSPFIMDQVDPQVLFVGLDNVYRTDNGTTSWTSIGSPSGAGKVFHLAQGVNNRSRLYASQAERIYRTNDALSSGSVSWDPVFSGLPTQDITRIAVDPNDAQQLWVTFGGYTEGEKVYYSFTGGDSWINISGSLPNVPVLCVAAHDNGQSDNAIYVGTEIGVFYRNAALGDWVYFNNFMPPVRVNDLYINNSANLIAAGTYGRGLWLSATYSGCDNNLTLSSPNITGHRYYSALNSISSTVNYKESLGTDIHYSAGNYIDLKPNFIVSSPGLFRAKIGDCPTINELLQVPEHKQQPGGQFLPDARLQSILQKEENSN